MNELMRDVLMVCRERAGISNAEIDTRGAHEELIKEVDNTELVMVCRDRAGISNAEIDTKVAHKRLTEKRKPIAKSPPACANQPGNPYHDSETGQLTRPLTSKKWCWSKFFKCPGGGRSRGKKGSGKRLAISNPPESGRGKDPAGQGCHICSTNTKKPYVPCDKGEKLASKKQREKRRSGGGSKVVSKRKTKR